MKYSVTAREIDPLDHPEMYIDLAEKSDRLAMEIESEIVMEKFGFSGAFMKFSSCLDFPNYSKMVTK